ncbi:putative RNA/DNA demethylase ALKBH6 isoform X2 [Babylonia areolata]
MVAEDLPQWLLDYSQRIADLGTFEGKVPNHVLVNEYLPGQGIMPHEDGPAFYPTVSTITLGSHALLDFYYHINTLPGQSAQQSTEGQSAQQSTEGQLAQQSTDGDSTQQPTDGESRAEQSTDGDSTPQQPTDGESRAQQSTDGDSSPQQPTDGESRAQHSTNGESTSQQSGQQSSDGDSSLDRRYFLSLLLQPRSLLLVQDDMYKVHLHGIKEVTHDSITDKVANLDLVPEVKVGDVMERKTRVSLTIRYVPKVLKSRLILGKR